jgi:hypothetical protein
MHYLPPLELSSDEIYLYTRKKEQILLYMKERKAKYGNIFQHCLNPLHFPPSDNS